MSEFECADCGALMLHGKCPTCGSTRAGRMDRKSAAEWAAIEKDNKREAEDVRSEQEYDEDYDKEEDEE